MIQTQSSFICLESKKNIKDQVPPFSVHKATLELDMSAYQLPQINSSDLRTHDISLYVYQIS